MYFYNNDEKTDMILIYGECRKNAVAAADLIIQAVLGCLDICDHSILTEVLKIMRNGGRIVKCLIAYLESKDKYYRALLNTIILAKCFEAKLWENSPYLSKQLPGIGKVMSSQLVNAGKTSFQLISECDAREIELLINKKPPFGAKLLEQVCHLPKYDLRMELCDPKKIKLIISLENAQNLEDKCTVNRNSFMYLIVGDSSNNILLFGKYSHAFMIENQNLIRYIDFQERNLEDVEANFISEDWVGIDCTAKFESAPKCKPQEAGQKGKVSKKYKKDDLNYMKTFMEMYMQCKREKKTPVKESENKENIFVENNKQGVQTKNDESCNGKIIIRQDITIFNKNDNGGKNYNNTSNNFNNSTTIQDQEKSIDDTSFTEDKNTFFGAKKYQFTTKKLTHIPKTVDRSQTKITWRSPLTYSPPIKFSPKIDYNRLNTSCAESDRISFSHVSPNAQKPKITSKILNKTSTFLSAPRKSTLSQSKVFFPLSDKAHADSSLDESSDRRDEVLKELGDFVSTSFLESCGLISPIKKKKVANNIETPKEYLDQLLSQSPVKENDEEKRRGELFGKIGKNAKTLQGTASRSRNKNLEQTFDKTNSLLNQNFADSPNQSRYFCHSSKSTSNVTELPLNNNQEPNSCHTLRPVEIPNEKMSAFSDFSSLSEEMCDSFDSEFQNDVLSPRFEKNLSPNVLNQQYQEYSDESKGKYTKNYKESTESTEEYPKHDRGKQLRKVFKFDKDLNKESTVLCFDKSSKQQFGLNRQTVAQDSYFKIPVNRFDQTLTKGATAFEESSDRNRLKEKLMHQKAKEKLYRSQSEDPFNDSFASIFENYQIPPQSEEYPNQYFDLNRQKVTQDANVKVPSDYRLDKTLTKGHTDLYFEENLSHQFDVNRPKEKQMSLKEKLYRSQSEDPLNDSFASVLRNYEIPSEILPSDENKSNRNVNLDDENSSNGNDYEEIERYQRPLRVPQIDNYARRERKSSSSINNSLNCDFPYLKQPSETGMDFQYASNKRVYSQRAPELDFTRNSTYHEDPILHDRDPFYYHTFRDNDIFERSYLDSRRANMDFSSVRNRVPGTSEYQNVDDNSESYRYLRTIMEKGNDCYGLRESGPDTTPRRMGLGSYERDYQRMYPQNIFESRSVPSRDHFVDHSYYEFARPYSKDYRLSQIPSTERRNIASTHDNCPSTSYGHDRDQYYAHYHPYRPSPTDKTYMMRRFLNTVEKKKEECSNFYN